MMPVYSINMLPPFLKNLRLILLFSLLGMLALPGLCVDLSEKKAPSHSAGTPLRFEKDGHPTIVYRQLTSSNMKILSVTAQVERIVQAVAAGPTQLEKVAGHASALPLGTTVHQTIMSDSRTVRIVLDLPDGFIESGQLTQYRLWKIGKQFETPLDGVPVLNVFLYIWDKQSGKAMDAQKLIKREEGTPLKSAPPRDEGYDGPLWSKGGPIVSPHTERSGSLSGKTVIINQGHGWFDDIDFGRWRVQRGVVSDYGILEDFSNAETINIYTLAYLRNAGAVVFTCRESDHQTNMVIVDNDDGMSNLSNGTYAETGSWINSTLRGFKQKTTPTWVGWANPFKDDVSNDHENRLSAFSASGETARATWIPTIPEAGYYNVYVSWSRYSGRAPDAQYMVQHSGGSTPFLVDQRQYGFTWYLLGNFYFEQGYNPASGAVVLTNHASAGNVSADAVRFGGGMGDVERRVHGISGRPRFEEEAVYHMQHMGAFRSIEGSGYDYFLSNSNEDDEQNGWSDRPQFARWLSQYCDDAVYIAHHTNAGGGTGTRSFAYENASTEILNLRQAVHGELVGDIRAEYDSGWDANLRSGNYGENNPNNLGSVPGFLLESLFHDHEVDTRKYRDPKFRMIMGRAIYRGIAKYFAERDGLPLVYLPEPPTHLIIRNLGNGTLRFNWDAPDASKGAASGYKVYYSANGYAFDNGRATTATSMDISGLPAGRVSYFRVSATNAGGESFPTATLAVGVSSIASRLLLVHGADRFDRYLPPWETVSNAGTVIRMEPGRFNSFDYSVQHGKAMQSAGYSFDAASYEAIEDADITLTAYQGVVWIGGQEAEADPLDNADNTSLKQGMRTQLKQFLEGGGNLFISGSEIGWDLARSSGPTQDEKNFFANYLKSQYIGDDSNTFQAQGSAGVFAGLPLFAYDDGSNGTYDVRFPDRLGAAGGSVAVMSYVGGSGGVAAIQYTGTFSDSSTTARLLYLGFPFETIVDESIRNEVMQRVLDSFDIIEPTPTPISTPTPTYQLTDVDRDNNVNQIDLLLLAAHWQLPATSVSSELNVDFVNNGIIDSDDLLFFLVHWKDRISNETEF
jgi:Fibronectin type III domain/Dockerin type I domain